MNERIAELWNKAAKSTKDDSWSSQVTFVEKIAELIVRECAGVAEVSMPVNSHPDDVLKVKNNVLEHFGVEE